MRHFHESMTHHEFLDWLRYSAIAGDMPPQFIDRVDALDRALSYLETKLDAEGRADLEWHSGS